MIGQGRLRVVQGDITQLDVEAVVTAANEGLYGGGGVDGAIHSAAGPQLVVASRKLAPCPAGEARITPAFEMSAKHVIHAVGPIYSNSSNDPKRLASAYRESLRLAAEHDVSSIAFPCISTGVYGYPKQPACDVAIETVLDWVRGNQSPHEIVFCCFGTDDYELYFSRLKELGAIQA